MSGLEDFLKFYSQIIKNLNLSNLFCSINEYIFIVNIKNVNLIRYDNNIINKLYASYSTDESNYDLIIGLNKIIFEQPVELNNLIFKNSKKNKIFYKSIDVAFYEDILNLNQHYTGLFKKWNSLGLMTDIGNYFIGKKNGIWKISNDINSTKLESYVDDIPNGTFREFENNKIVYEYIFSQLDQNMIIMKIYKNFKYNKCISINLNKFEIVQCDYFKNFQDSIYKTIESSQYNLTYYSSYRKYLILIIQPTFNISENFYNHKIVKHNKHSYLLTNYKIIKFINKFNPNETFNSDEVDHDINVLVQKKFYDVLEMAFYDELDKTNYQILKGPYKKWNEDDDIIIDIK